MKLETNKSLLHYNTFGIDVISKYFLTIASKDDLSEFIASEEYSKEPKLVLGGGSNILFTKNFDGLVLKNDIKGIEILSESEDDIILRVGAGENWHEFVMHCVNQNYGGVENLSLIPGNVGASPMQNIGAYGVEVKNTVHSVEFTDIRSGQRDQLNADSCEFGYRTSIFKTKYKGQKFITHVRYKLSKNPKLNTSYGAIENELERLQLEPSIQNISKAVINIRHSKLPDPKVIGNAGSFFKNPVVDIAIAESIKKNYQDLPMYPGTEGRVKLAAGWLIEKAGWKGKRFESYGVHEKQALVLVNYGGATGQNINQLSNDIQSDISNKFGIELEKEVNII